MRVLQISNQSYLYSFGGIEKNILNLLNIEKHIIIDHLIISKNFSHKYFKYKNSKIFASSRKSQFGLIKAIFFFYKNYNKYDYIHFHHPRTIIFILFCLSSHKRIISTIHANVVDYFRYKFFSIFNLIILYKSKATILLNKNIIDNDTYYKFKKKITIIPHGEIENKYQINDKKYFLCIGRGNATYKNFHYLESLKNVSFKIYLIGLTPSNFSKYKFPKNVTPIYDVSDEIKNHLIKNSTAIISLSDSRLETLNISIIEGFKHKKPAITIKGSLANHTVNEHMVTGLILDKKEDLEKSIELITNNKLYSDLSKGAFKKYQKKFNINLTNKSYVELLKSIS